MVEIQKLEWIKNDKSERSRKKRGSATMREGLKVTETEREEGKRKKRKRECLSGYAEELKGGTANRKSLAAALIFSGDGVMRFLPLTP